MIKNVSATTGADFIHITWSQPKILPSSYRVHIGCWLVHVHIEYVREELEASPLSTMFIVDQLLPGSRCVITLLAIYNPASIDDGITHTLFTPNSSVYNRIWSMPTIVVLINLQICIRATPTCMDASGKGLSPMVMWVGGYLTTYIGTAGPLHKLYNCTRKKSFIEVDLGTGTAQSVRCWSRTTSSLITSVH